MNVTTDRVVLAVIGFLGLFAIAGLGGLVWLLDHGTDPVAIAVIAGPVSAAVGTLGGLLASTRTTSAAVHEAKAEGYAEAVAKVESLPTAPPVPVEVVNAAEAPVPVAETPQPPPNVDPANPRH